MSRRCDGCLENETRERRIASARGNMDQGTSESGHQTIEIRYVCRYVVYLVGDQSFDSSSRRNHAIGRSVRRYKTSAKLKEESRIRSPFNSRKARKKCQRRRGDELRGLRHFPEAATVG